MSFSIPNALNLVAQTPILLPTYSGAPDWVSITGAVTNEVLLLVSDATGGNYTIRTTFTRPASENIYIDWGDGSPVDTISSTSSTNSTHTYSGGGTPSSRGYNTWRVRIYGDAGTRITGAQVVKNSTDALLYPSGLLQVWYGDNTVTTLREYFRAVGTSIAPSMSFLEYVRVPNGLTDPLSFNLTFDECRTLQKVDLPTSLSVITSLYLTFSSCSALQELGDFPADMTAVDNMDSTFLNCGSLPKITFRNTLNQVTTLNDCFRNCSSLGWINLPATPVCTNYSNTFNGCVNLRSMSIPIIANTTVSMFATFNNCRRLQSITLDPTTTATINGSSFFAGCDDLRLVNLPPNCNMTTYNAMFINCNNLLEVTFPMNATNVQTFAQVFSSCFLLQRVTLPSTPPSAQVSFNQAFIGCGSLSEIIIPSGYNVGIFTSAFQGCTVLQNISIPSSVNVNNFDSTFNGCSMLEYVTLPPSLGNVTTMNNMFLNCFSLKEVTFPTTMNSCNNINGLFNNCYSLQRVILPTSMSALGGIGGASMANTFNNCRQLRSVVFPTNASMSSLSTVATMFSNCYSLTSITLPPVSSNAVTIATSMFSNTPSLTGITNIEFFGNSGSTTTNYVNGTTMGVSSNVLSLDFRCKFSKLDLNGTDTGVGRNKLNSLRLRNSGAGQYGGTSPHINVSFTSLGQAALVQLFNDLPTITAKTINITSATGAAALTAGERAIATGKGWTIVG
jgi:hypothetical protein